MIDIIGMNVEYIGKNNHTLKQGTSGVIINYYKKQKKNKHYSAHVDIKCESIPNCIFNTVYPLTTWQSIINKDDDQLMYAMIEEEQMENDGINFSDRLNCDPRV